MKLWKAILLFSLAGLARADQVQITSPLPLPVVMSTGTASAIGVYLNSQAIQLDPNGRSDDQPVYVGFAAPGTSTGSSGWKILEILYDASGCVSQVLWANGTANFDKTWSNRSSYSYS